MEPPSTSCSGGLHVQHVPAAFSWQVVSCVPRDVLYSFCCSSILLLAVRSDDGARGNSRGVGWPTVPARGCQATRVSEPLLQNWCAALPRNTCRATSGSLGFPAASPAAISVYFS